MLAPGTRAAYSEERHLGEGPLPGAGVLALAWLFTADLRVVGLSAIEGALGLG
jgi:hypothetical protein